MLFFYRFWVLKITAWCHSTAVLFRIIQGTTDASWYQKYTKNLFKEPLISRFLFLSMSFRLTFFCNAASSSLNHELRVSQCRSVHGERWSSWRQALSAVQTPQRPRASAGRHQRRLRRARWSGSPESQVHVGLEQRQIWLVFMRMIEMVENWFLWLTQNNDTNSCSFFPRLFMKKHMFKTGHIKYHWLYLRLSSCLHFFFTQAGLWNLKLPSTRPPLCSSWVSPMCSIVKVSHVICLRKYFKGVLDYDSTFFKGLVHF